MLSELFRDRSCPDLLADLTSSRQEGASASDAILRWSLRKLTLSPLSL